MKYIYIAGLEHSGTTLLSQILSNAENVLALGEIGQFFSPGHMRQYIGKWGEYPDVRRCSCGADWTECEFWSSQLDLYGLSRENSEDKGARYAALFERLAAQHPTHTIVDSSKSLIYLQAASRAWQSSGNSLDDFVILLLYKDPRAFAQSQGRKGTEKPSLLNYYRWQNLWASCYQRYLEFLESSSVKFFVISYSDLCADPDEVLKGVALLFNLKSADWSVINHQNSHVAIGNKDFTERNRIEIREDTAWRKDRKVRLAYLLNRRARRLAGRIAEVK